MRASRIAAITVMGAAAFGVSAATAATASANDGRAGRIEVAPHVGATNRISGHLPRVAVVVVEDALPPVRSLEVSMKGN